MQLTALRIREHTLEVEGEIANFGLTIYGKKYRVAPHLTSDFVETGQETKSAVGILNVGEAIYDVYECAEQDPHQSLDALTARELQITKLIAHGMCDKAIARELGISENTVREHLRRVFHKLAITKRTSLVARCIRSGLD